MTEAAPFETPAGPLACTVCGHDRFRRRRQSLFFGFAYVARPERMQRVACDRCGLVRWFDR